MSAQIEARFKSALAARKRHTQQIKQAVAEMFEISVKKLTSPIREQRLVFARWLAFRLMRNRGMILEDIGREFGRDHGTVEHGLEQLQYCSGANDALKALEERLKNS